MPIMIPNGLPAAKTLADENIFVMNETRAVSLSRMENETLVIHGRHDPCIVPRAVPCVEAAAAIAIYDAWLARRGETERT